MTVKFAKRIYDCIHGFICISNLACEFIDNPFFQRLKFLRQLGTCHYVYPSAVHTRFEHSLGTYYLADRVLKCIKKQTIDGEHAKKFSAQISSWLLVIPELHNYYQRTYGNQPIVPLDDYVCELIKIAALCHDIGHGPFSHLFDDVFLPYVKSKTNPMAVHENRSQVIVEHIIKNNQVLCKTIYPDEIKFIQDLINPPKGRFGFVYQIVSNKLNDLDVDKYDYIARDNYHTNLRATINYSRLVDDITVINNTICYPSHIYLDIAEIFRTRYKLHRLVYCHKAVINIQFMIRDLLIATDEILGLSKSINSDNLDHFLKLTDDYIMNSIQCLSNIPGFSVKPELIKAKQIFHQINNRLLYKCAGVIVTDTKIHLDQTKLCQVCPELEQDNIEIFQTVVGYVSGNKDNPLNNIFFYDSNNIDECFRINQTDKTHMLSDKYQEHLTMVFSKSRDPKILKTLKKAVKMCG